MKWILLSLPAILEWTLRFVRPFRINWAPHCGGLVMNIDFVHRFLQRTFRPNRMRVFIETFGVTCKTKILDVGGSPSIWEDCPFRPDVTLVNTLADWPRKGFKLVYADATNLPFPDGSFD